MNIIVDEKVEQLNKEEKLLLALNEVSNEKLFQKAKVLFKKGVYSKDLVENFDEEAYIEVSPKTIKGYSLLTNDEGELFLVKALKADSETDVYGVEVLSLPNVTDEEMKTLADYKKPVCITKIVVFSFFSLFMLIGLYSFLYLFFESLSSGFDVALLSAFNYVGGYLLIGLGLLLLILKNNKKCCKK